MHKKWAKTNVMRSDATDDNIYKAIKSAQGRAKATVDELGMADLFVRHLLWNSWHSWH